MSKQFINEVSRMKDLFGYKKGQVISEQDFKPFDPNGSYPSLGIGGNKSMFTPKQIEAINAGWPKGISDEGAKALKVGPDGKILPNSTSTPNTDLEQMDKDYLSKPITGKPDSNHGKQMPYKEPNGTTSISIWDGYIHNYMPKAIWEKKFGKLKPKPVIQIPKELKDAEGVKKFQYWMDTNHPNWVKGSKNLNKGGGYGKFGPSTSTAWNKYKNEYLGGSKTTDNTNYPVNKMMAGTKDFPGAFNTGGIGVPNEEDGELYTTK
jgi:hypothetical protein